MTHIAGREHFNKTPSRQSFATQLAFGLRRSCFQRSKLGFRTTFVLAGRQHSESDKKSGKLQGGTRNRACHDARWEAITKCNVRTQRAILEHISQISVSTRNKDSWRLGSSDVSTVTTDRPLLRRRLLTRLMIGVDCRFVLESASNMRSI